MLIYFTELERRLLGSVSPALFALGSILTFILADHIKNSGSGGGESIGGGGSIGGGSSGGSIGDTVLSQVTSSDTFTSGVASRVVQTPISGVAPAASVAASQFPGGYAVASSFLVTNATSVISEAIATSKAMYTNAIEVLISYANGWSQWSWQIYTNASSVILSWRHLASDAIGSAHQWSSASSVGVYARVGLSQALIGCSHVRSCLSSAFSLPILSTARNLAYSCYCRSISGVYCVTDVLWSRIQFYWCSGSQCFVVSWCSSAVHYCGALYTSVCTCTSSTLRWLYSVVLPRLYSSSSKAVDDVTSTSVT